MKLRTLAVVAVALAQFTVAQPRLQPEAGWAEKFDSTAVARIIDEGISRSRIMETLSWLTDVCGARLTGSPGYKRAAEWTRAALDGWGLANAHLEGWGPFGRGWSMKRYNLQVLEPLPFTLISYPKAWSPGTPGTVRAEAVYLDGRTDSALRSYRGKLGGKFVLISEPRSIGAHFEPEATRLADSTLLEMADALPDSPRRGRAEFFREFQQRLILENKKVQLCKDEGAAAILTAGNGDDGTVFVQSVSIPFDPDTPREKRPRAYDLHAPPTPPQVVLAAENYGRMVRMLAGGVDLRLEMNLEVSETREDSVYNVLAELPGSDVAGEIVMIGGHLDSWHAGTGATDNGTGVAVCMEAMRILKALGLKPRRTIRIALWGGEEEGLLGSHAYVERHFGVRKPPTDSGPAAVALRPEAENFSVYFNNDNGSGKVRGIYLQGNETVRDVFRSWLVPFHSMGASTITALNTGGTDHLSFDEIGLPGFQFIQDPIEYDTRTHHSNMDVYERVQESDVKQAAVIMAAFAYNAAMRDGKIPRKAQ